MPAFSNHLYVMGSVFVNASTQSADSGKRSSAHLSFALHGFSYVNPSRIPITAEFPDHLANRPQGHAHSAQLTLQFPPMELQARYLACAVLVVFFNESAEPLGNEDVRIGQPFKEREIRRT